ncbi:hypothetical protein C8R48DRAFT_676782 [Suillus tomentosus]|nr:hypothetical protein C8R48DRAFT_676782 [Suillus tomentosus]
MLMFLLSILIVLLRAALLELWDYVLSCHIMKTCFKTPKTLNKVTGKETSTEHMAFSVVKWGSKTTAFIHAAQKKGLEAIQLTASMAYKHLRKPCVEKYTSINSDDEMGDREDIW